MSRTSLEIHPVQKGWMLAENKSCISQIVLQEPPYAFSDGVELLRTIAELLGIKGIEIVMALDVIDDRVELYFPSGEERVGIGVGLETVTDVPPASDSEKPPSSLGGDLPPA